MFPHISVDFRPFSVLLSELASKLRDKEHLLEELSSDIFCLLEELSSDGLCSFLFLLFVCSNEVSCKCTKLDYDMDISTLTTDQLQEVSTIALHSLNITN